MNAKRLQRFLQALLLGTCLSIFALTSAYAADAVKVTADNYVRAESDFQMKGYVKTFKCFGKFYHSRKPYDVENQVTVRGNRDTLYSFGVFDLTSPLTIMLPDTKGRYQSLMVVNQDHSIAAAYGPKTVTLTQDKVGTRYVTLTVRTFADPNDEADMKKAFQLQDAVGVKQADIGKFEVPGWKKGRGGEDAGDDQRGCLYGYGYFKNVRQERSVGPGLLDAGCCSRLGRAAGRGRHLRECGPRKERWQDPLHTHRQGRAGGRLLVGNSL